MGTAGVAVTPQTVDSENTVLAFTHDQTAADHAEYSVQFHAQSTCDLLMVAGGGGGGTVEFFGTSGTGAGGGGGGVIFLQNLAVSAGSYDIKVGKGGEGDDYSDMTQRTGRNGFKSTFSYLLTEAVGGGGGGSRTFNSGPNDHDNTLGHNGGSGGGSNYKEAGDGDPAASASGSNNGGHGTVSDILKYDGTTVLRANYRQGYNGGLGEHYMPYSSGGGGAGGNGYGPDSSNQNNLQYLNPTSSDGGIGRAEENGLDFKTYFNIQSSIGQHHTDSKVYFAGGGSSGFRQDEYNVGGLGGGGDSTNTESIVHGMMHTGGGGAGARSGGASNAITPTATLINGGNGGSGVVVLKCRASV